MQLRCETIVSQSKATHDFGKKRSVLSGICLQIVQAEQSTVIRGHVDVLVKVLILPPL